MNLASLANLREPCQRLARSALDLLFPVQCQGCGQENVVLCSHCAAQLPRLTPPFCRICAQPGVSGVCNWCSLVPPPLDGIRSVCLMEGLARECIHRLKYRNVRALAPALGQVLYQSLDRHPLPVDVIVPVPLHPQRLRQRGYNQAGLLARELGKLTNIPVAEGMLERRKNTPSQTNSRSRAERQTNVEDSFQARGDPSGKAVLLIDDVATTGSTLFAGAAPLRAAGANSVWGLTLARES